MNFFLFVGLVFSLQAFPQNMKRQKFYQDTQRSIAGFLNQQPSFVETYKELSVADVRLNFEREHVVARAELRGLDEDDLKSVNVECYVKIKDETSWSYAESDFYSLTFDFCFLLADGDSSPFSKFSLLFKGVPSIKEINFLGDEKPKVVLRGILFAFEK